MAMMSCYACDTRFDRLTRRCPNCGTYVLIERVVPQPAPAAPPPPLVAIEPNQDTEPFTIIRPTPAAPIPFKRRKPVAPLLLITIIAAGIGVFLLSTRPTSSARDDNPTPTQTSVQPAAVSTRRPDPTTPPPTPTASPTPLPTATTTPQPPTPTATTPPTPSPTMVPPSPTSRPVVSTDDVVVNGGFEEGDHAWHLENGARAAGINVHDGQRALILPAGGAYADQAIDLVPGGTYRLTAWARVGAEGDTGEVGLRFLDDHGQVIEDRDAPQLRFTAATYTRLNLTFTVPADAAAAKIIVWKPAGSGILAVDSVSVRGVDQT